jgi:serine/threonine-protein kinase
VGSVINDRYKIVALVARGGMGKVYQAEQAPLGRICALKVVDSKYARDCDPEFRKRFFWEASITSKLTHPNTVTIFHYGQTDGLFYTAMEFLEGRTLHRAIREESPLGEERTGHIAKQVCRSLREAHALGVIHRNLKPANIFLMTHGDEEDFVKVLDFGLVKHVKNLGEALTQAGFFIGSPKYMAPEHIKGDKVDGRMDVYSLGIVMYEMLTGKAPFDRPNPVHIMMAHVDDPPPPMRSINPDIDVSSAMEELVLRCLSKDPEQRPASMESLLQSLRSMGHGSSSSIPSPPDSGEIDSPLSARQGNKKKEALLLPKPAEEPKGNKKENAKGNGKKNHAPSKVRNAIWLALILLFAGTFALFAMQKQLRESNEHVAATQDSVHQAASTLASAPQVAPAMSSAPLSAQENAQTSASASASASSSASPAPSVAVISIDSIPRGAIVRDRNRGNLLCETTPCELRFEGEDAAAEKQHDLMFLRMGYQRTDYSVKGSDKEVRVSLEPRAPSTQPAAPAAPAAPTASSAPAVPEAPPLPAPSPQQNEAPEPNLELK